MNAILERPNLNTLLWTKRKIIYVAIGKTASTSVKIAIAQDEGFPLPEGQSPHFNPRLAYTNDFGQIATLLDNGWMSLVVERDPVDRFTSWWGDKMNRPAPSERWREFGFDPGWDVNDCAMQLKQLSNLTYSGWKHADPILRELETHLAPQRHIQDVVLSCRRPNIAIPFSSVNSAFDSLFDIVLPLSNPSTGTKEDRKLNPKALDAVFQYYADDRTCLR